MHDRPKFRQPVIAQGAERVDVQVEGRPISGKPDCRLSNRIGLGRRSKGAMLGLTAEVWEVPRLSEPIKAAMYALYETYYEATSPERFLTDLYNKDAAILLGDEQGSLQGFSTLSVLSFEFQDSIHRAIFSGDTIVSDRHWGQHALAFTWIRHAGRIKAQARRAPLYWFLITKGHRTYRYLRVFSKSFYPHWQKPTPPREQSIINLLANRRFGDYYDASKGILHFPESRGHLKAPWAQVSPEHLRRPDVQYFLERNPNYVRGDELVCLTELHPHNLQPLTRRLFMEGMRS